MDEEFELLYAGASIKDYIGEYPILEIKVKVNIKHKDENTSFVYIPQLNFKVKLYYTESYRSNSGYSSVGTFGVYSSEPLFLEKSNDITISIPINTQKFEEMQKIRRMEKIVSFQFEGKWVYSSYNDSTKQYSIFYPSTGIVKKIMPEGTKSDLIMLTTEEFIDIAKDIKHFEVYRLEIPISKIETSAQKELQKAIELMESAKNHLIQNNYNGALLDIRNAISNHLFEKNKEGENILKNEIKDYVLEKVPDDSKDTYKEILKNITSSLNSSLKNLHKFVHKDSDKLKLSPMPQDIETIYFTTIHLIKYFASYG